MNSRIDLRCTDGCTILSVERFEGEHWIEFYTNVHGDASWGWRVKTAWKILRGKNHYLDALILEEAEIPRLLSFLTISKRDLIYG